MDPVTLGALGTAALGAAGASGASAGVLAATALGTAAVVGGAGYQMNKQNQAMKKSLRPPTLPTPPTAAAPPTLAKATAGTKAKAPSLATPAKAGGTIGDMGPSGLSEPPKTANLTLLGGTR